MIPSHELRLQSMLRAMTEVIIPALDREQQLAIDQANIPVGTCGCCSSRRTRSTSIKHVELREYVAAGAPPARRTGRYGRCGTLAAALAALAAAEPVATPPVPTQPELVARRWCRASSRPPTRC
ncbi:MAG: hypothetical protein U1F11_07090 [Steroidobacteraceae bacterium]